MKQKYSICIFISLILIFVVIILFTTADKTKNNTTEQSKMQETESQESNEEAVYSSKTEESYQYIIFDVDGHLLVYYADNCTVFFDTGIQTKNLSEDMKSALEKGIRFQTEEELYEFLENYSS